MPAKISSAGNLSQNPQEAVIATYICFLTNFTELELTNIQANYWWGQMHCGPCNQNFGGAMAHPAHAAAPLWLLDCQTKQADWRQYIETVRTTILVDSAELSVLESTNDISLLADPEESLQKPAATEQCGV